LSTFAAIVRCSISSMTTDRTRLAMSVFSPDFRLKYAVR
jgi:hypothetical protein